MSMLSADQPSLEDDRHLAGLERVNGPLMLIIGGAIVGVFKQFAAYAFSIPTAAGLLGCLYLSLTNMTWALWVAVQSLPFLTLTVLVGGTMISPGDFLLALGLGAWMVKFVLLGGLRPLPIPSQPFVVAFFILSVFSSIGSPANILTDLFQTLAFLWTIPLWVTNIIKTSKDLMKIMNAIVISGVVGAIFSLIDAFFGKGGRALGILAEPNTAACFFVLAIAYSLPLAVLGKNILWRVFHSIATLTLTYALILTSSRGGWIALAVMILILGLTLGPRKAFRIAIVFGLIYLVFKNQLPAGFEERFTSIQSSDEENLGYRPAQFRAAFEVIRREPFLGAGPGNLLHYTIVNRDDELQTMVGLVHNLFLQIAAERGVPALLMFVFMFINHLVLAYQGLKNRLVEDWVVKISFLSALMAVAGFVAANQAAYFLLRGPGGLLGVIIGLLGATLLISAKEENARLEEAMSVHDLSPLLSVPRPAV